MTHSANKNSFKVNDLPFSWRAWQVLASVLARKNRLKTMRCHKWHKWQGKNGMTGILASKKRKKRAKRECNWNVNKPYRNVNWKVEKSANGQDKRQFTHSSILSYYYIYIYIIFYIIYYRVAFFHPLFAAFRAPACYFVLLLVNCCANVTPLYGHGEVMGGTLTNVAALFLVLFKCKQIRTLYDFLTLMVNSVK